MIDSHLKKEFVTKSYNIVKTDLTECKVIHLKFFTFQSFKKAKAKNVILAVLY